MGQMGFYFSKNGSHAVLCSFAVIRLVSRCAFPLVFPLFLMHGITHRGVPPVLSRWIVHCCDGLRATVQEGSSWDGNKGIFFFQRMQP